ncbi:MAG: macro domain-containing protein [Oligoflexia bacterium]|nr:macro domain-containing protein [Oligoflexia bacterium]
MTGEAKITAGHHLHARHVIHTVGPIWSPTWDNSNSNDSGDKQLAQQQLASCYRNCMQLAKKHKLKDIAFPAISTGAYRFPLALATKIAINEVTRFLIKNNAQNNDQDNDQDFPQLVIFVAYDRKVYLEYLNNLQLLQ